MLPPPTPMDPYSVRSLQTAAIHSMLTCSSSSQSLSSSSSSSSTSSSSFANKWRILIYDTQCRSIISPLFSVPALRSLGITLHMMLASSREPIPDVPAIYFVQPTLENVDLIAKDCANDLYSHAYLNFTSKLPRQLMERLASSLVSSNSVSKVAAIHDQFVDFVTLERTLLTLNLPNSYTIYNSPKTAEVEMKRFVEQVSNGLFCVACTWGKVPIIRCKRGGIAEAVATSLTKLVQENPIVGDLVASRNSNTTNNNNNSNNKPNRPMLILMERNDDLNPILSHSSTYQSLIDDLLPHSNNRVTCVTKGSDGAPDKTQNFDLDGDVDPFYNVNKFKSFPEVIEANGVTLKEIAEKENLIRSKTVGNGDTLISEDINSDTNSNANSTLTSAVDSLPALLARKKQLEIHTSILQTVMTAVASRDVPVFFEAEANFSGAINSISGQGKSKAEVSET